MRLIAMGSGEFSEEIKMFFIFSRVMVTAIDLYTKNAWILLQINYTLLKLTKKNNMLINIETGR